MRTPTDTLRRQFTAWQDSLVASDSSQQPEIYRDPQERLLEAVDSGRTALVSYLESELDVVATEIDWAPPLLEPLTDPELWQPPVEREASLGDEWARTISPRAAAEPVFWVGAHIVWMAKELVAAHPPDALAKSYRHATTIDGIRDNRTRTVLRHLAGLPKIRLAGSAMTDCPPGRAYWRRKIARDAASASAGLISVEQAHTALWKNSLWERWVLLAGRRVTVLSIPSVRSAMVTWLVEHPDTNEKKLEILARHIGREGAHTALGVLHPADVLEMLKEAPADL